MYQKRPVEWDEGVGTVVTVFKDPITLGFRRGGWSTREPCPAVCVQVLAHPASALSVKRKKNTLRSITMSATFIIINLFLSEKIQK